MSTNNSAHAARELTTKTYFLLLKDAAKSVPQRVQSNLSYCMDLSIMVRHKRDRVDILMKQLLGNPASPADGLKSDEAAKLTKEVVCLLAEITAIRDKESLTLQGTAAYVDDAASQLDEAFQRGEQYFRQPRRRVVEKDSEMSSVNHAASARITNGVTSASSGDAEKQKRSPVKQSRRETSTSATRNRGVLKKRKLDREQQAAKAALILSKSHKAAREKNVARYREKASKSFLGDQQTSPSSHSSLERSGKNALLEAAACLSGDKKRIKQPRAARSAKVHATTAVVTPTTLAASDRLSVYEFGPTTPPISPPGALDALRAAAQAVGQMSSSTTTSGDDDNRSSKRKPRRSVSVARLTSNVSAVSASLPPTASTAAAALPTRDRPHAVSSSTSSSTASSSTPVHDRKILSSEQKREVVDTGVPIVISSMATTRSPGTPTDAPPLNGERKEQPAFSSGVKPKGTYVRRKLKDVDIQQRRKIVSSGENAAKRRRLEKPLSGRSKSTADRTTSISRKVDKNLLTSTINPKRHSDDDSYPLERRNAGGAENTITSSSREASPAPTVTSNATTTLTTRGTVRKRRLPGTAMGGRRGTGARHRQPSGMSTAEAGDSTKSTVGSSKEEPAGSSSSLLPTSRRKTAEPKSTAQPPVLKSEVDQESTTYVRPQEAKLSKQQRTSPKDESPEVATVTMTSTNTKDDVLAHAGQFDEAKFCLCNQVSYGQMVACDNDTCKIEWFHFECVGLKATPRGRWYCPDCRGDKHHVLKAASATNLRKVSNVSGTDDE